MSKRKIGAGGYVESSEDSDVEAPPQTVPKKRYKPPMISTTKKTMASFLLPKPSTPAPSSRGSLTPAPVASSSKQLNPTPRPVPATSHMPTPKDTPALHKDLSLWDHDLSDSDPEKDSPTSPIASIGHQTVAQAPPSVPNMPSIPLDTVRARSNVQLERSIHELGANLEEQKRQAAEYFRQLDEKLTLVLQTIDRLAIAPQAGVAPAPAPATDPALTGPTSYLRNPPVTDEMKDIIANVSSSTRERTGTKEKGALANSLRAHARDTWTGMLRVAHIKDVGPFFLDEHNRFDTLPAQFTDPKTMYCQPFPHPKAPLTQQTEWVPTYVLRFKKTTPADNSEASKALRELSDQQIVTLLYDGPFKTFQNYWGQTERSQEELEEMQAKARRYMRVERKITIRSAHINGITSLRNPDFGFLSNAGYASAEVSDGEGGIDVLRPEYRAQWVSNLFDAIRRAELVQASRQPGICPRPPPRRIQIVTAPIPPLQHGTGKTKTTIRVAACSISKSWRKNNEDEHKRSAQHINHKANTKPDISEFLSQHPVPTESDDEEDEDDLDVEADVIGDGEGMGTDKGLDEYEEGEVNAAGGKPDRDMDLGKGKGRLELESDVTDTGLNDMTAIDPLLRPRTAPQGRALADGHPGANPPQATLATQTAAAPPPFNVHYPHLPSNMIPPPMPPPPPPPQAQPDAPTGKPAKKRGRPPGSRNKPKVTQAEVET
ncbi:hypothetical protein BDV93DRAFT_552656 [Ceratobasidium sp. AG-I]|nr:hypothetical protein BDV93DRAFT_552656 [Ceratobasidium sp. AG-I]